MLRSRRSASFGERQGRPVAIEGLESRCLLSGSAEPAFFGHFPGLGILTGGDFHFHHNQFVVGTVTSVNTTADTITVTDPVEGSSTPTTYTLATNATITANDTTATLGSLLPGAQVALQLSTDATTSVTTVTSVTAISQSAAGIVTNVSATASTITLTGLDGSNTTYTVGTGATVMLDGSTSTLGGLGSGDLALLTLSALDGKTVTRISARSTDLFGHHGFDQHVRATVVSVNTTADTITVSTSSNGSPTQTTYTVDPMATITADGVATTLDKLLAGAQVSLTVSSSSSTTVTAIAASSQHVFGTVSSVDATANTITLNPHGGSTTTYTVGSGATITVNGSTAVISGIAAGSLAQLTLSAFDGKTVTAVSDHSAPIFGHFHPINATVVSIDTTTEMITVSTVNHGATTQTTYAIGQGATITADGAATPLSSLSAGAHVLVTLSATSATTATSIAAFSQFVTGTVTSFDTTAHTITITNHNGFGMSGTSNTYTLGTGATITLNGAASTLSALVAGTRVRLTLSALDGSTVTAVAGSTPFVFVHHHRAAGMVTAVDTTAGTITISSTFFGSTTTTTYTLAAGATITANGATTALGSLLPGAQVILQLSTIGATTTVGSINALTEHARGVVSSVNTTGNTITITPHDGTAQTYTVMSGATVTLNGASSTLASLTAGVHVQLTLSALDGKTVTAVRAHM